MGEKILKWTRIFIEGSLFVSSGFSIYGRNWELLFFTTIALVAIYFSRMFFRHYKIKLPIEFEFIITAFIYSSFVLGEAQNYYGKFIWWDTMLHALSGVVLGFAGFLILYVLYMSKRLKTSPSFVAFFSFLFALAFGTIWEIFEFAMDITFDIDMQVNSLHDTMIDLVVDGMGGIVSALWGYFYLKFGKMRFDNLVKKFKDKNPQLFEETKN